MKFVSRCYSLVLFVSACAQPINACIWYEGTTLEGGLTKTGESAITKGNSITGGRGFGSGTEKNLASVLRIAVKLAAANAPEVFLPCEPLPEGWPQGMDDAVRLIFAGDAAGAQIKLQALNDKVPGNYYICANLAAACELAGDLPEALRWVRKALEINPQAHEGTEWMHEAVIKARLSLQQDPAWLTLHTISGIPKGDVPKDFVLKVGSRTLSLEDVHRALTAHTYARLLFVKPTDTVAAALLTELAHVEARRESVENGFAMLDLAKEYGAHDTDFTKARWEKLIPRESETWGSSLGPAQIRVLTAAVAAILLYIAYYLYRRRRDSSRNISS